jgi:hypothetical protein
VTEYQLKAKYGRVFSARTESGVLFYFRLITKKELEIFSSMCSSEGDDVTYHAKEYLAETAIVYPSMEELSPKLLAGELAALTPYVLELSGFTSMDYFTNKINEYEQGFEHSVSEIAVAFILSAMPAYKVKDIEDMTTDEVCRHIVMAEYIMKVEFPFKGVQQQQQKAALLAGKDQANQSAEEEEGRRKFADEMRTRGAEALKQVKARK